MTHVGGTLDHMKRKRRADRPRIMRQWAMAELLATSGRAWSVKELADELDVSKSTAQRDIDELSATFAVAEDHDGEQRIVYRLARLPEWRPAHASAAHLFAAKLAERLI